MARRQAAIQPNYRRVYLLVFALILAYFCVTFAYQWYVKDQVDIAKELLEDVRKSEDSMARGAAEEYADAKLTVPRLAKGEKRRMPRASVPEINCTKLINGQRSEQMRAFSRMRKFPALVDDSVLTEFLNLTCDDFVYKRYECEFECVAYVSYTKRVFFLCRRYVTVSQSEEEASFPIAFSISMHKDVAQFERLFRAIYRPEHAYCIHVDANAAEAGESIPEQTVT